MQDNVYVYVYFPRDFHPAADINMSTTLSNDTRQTHNKNNMRTAMVFTTGQHHKSSLPVAPLNPVPSLKGKDLSRLYYWSLHCRVFEGIRSQGGMRRHRPQEFQL